MSARAKQIAALIELEPGYQVDMFGGMLSVYRLDDGRYAVHSTTTDGEGKEVLLSESLHLTAIRAAAEFERVRKKRQLGYEFEIE